MAEISIPGRRLTDGESMYTDWLDRGGDSMLLRAECIERVGTTTVRIALETRAEPGATITPNLELDYPASASYMTLNSESVFDGLWLATQSGVTSTTPNSIQAQLRLKVTCTGGSSGDYMVVRIFPPTFFDNSQP